MSMSISKCQQMQLSTRMTKWASGGVYLLSKSGSVVSWSESRKEQSSSFVTVVSERKLALCQSGETTEAISVWEKWSVPSLGQQNRTCAWVLARVCAWLCKCAVRKKLETVMRSKVCKWKEVWACGSVCARLFVSALDEKLGHSLQLTRAEDMLATEVGYIIVPYHQTAPLFIGWHEGGTRMSMWLKRESNCLHISCPTNPERKKEWIQIGSVIRSPNGQFILENCLCSFLISPIPLYLVVWLFTVAVSSFPKQVLKKGPHLGPLRDIFQRRHRDPCFFPGSVQRWKGDSSVGHMLPAGL